MWKTFGWLCFGVLFYFWAVSVNFLWLFGASPSLESVEKAKPAQASRVFSADGKILGYYFRENRSPVEFKKISPFLINALIATEDVRFHQHSGIDPEGTLSAVMHSLTGENRGGSTITQQLAKNLYKIRKTNSSGLFSKIPVVKTIIAKSKEWITAIKLEQHYTKNEILTMYLNTVDFGRNSFGVKTAANTFFNAAPDSLRIEEAALLVGMLKATSYYNPYRFYNHALKRRNTVLNQMVKYGFISQTAFDSLSKLPINLSFKQDTHPDGPLTYYGPALTAYLKNWGKLQDSADPDYIYKAGLNIYTTIDTRLQSRAEESVAQHLTQLQEKFDRHWQGKNPWVDEQHNEIPQFIENIMRRSDLYKKLLAKYKDTTQVWQALNTPHRMVLFNWKKPDGDTVEMSSLDSLKYCKKMLHAGLMTMDPFSGYIKAWVGGIDYRFFKYDHVKQSHRQPGSTFKAFVYAAAMDKGYGPCFKMVDKQITYNYDELENGVMVKKTWTPHNATGTFSGMSISLRYALGRSINSIAAQMTQKLGAETVADCARRLGISSPLKAIPSIGLGSNDVTLYEMVGAYCSFLNEGRWTEPLLVSRIEDHNGNIVKQFKSKSQRAISPEAAYLMIHMLKGTLQEPGGTAQALFSYQVFRNNELAGKTGTSSNQSDGWFIGLTKDLVTGVWVGADERCIHFRSLSMGEGSKTALPIYGLYMEKLYADTINHVEVGRFAKPSVKISQKTFCPTHLPKPDTLRPDSGALPEQAQPPLPGTVG